MNLFEPHDFSFDYKVIVTNKTESTKAVVQFHNGRSSQKGISGDVKGDCGLIVIATQRLVGNQIYTLCAMMAHNLCKAIQMLAKPAAQRRRSKRPVVWEFKTLDTLRHRVIQRAGRLTRPQGELTLTMSPNKAVREDLFAFSGCSSKSSHKFESVRVSQKVSPRKLQQRFFICQSQPFLISSIVLSLVYVMDIDVGGLSLSALIRSLTAKGTNTLPSSTT